MISQGDWWRVFTLGDSVPAIDRMEQCPVPVLRLQDILPMEQYRGKFINCLNIPLNIVCLGSGHFVDQVVVAEVASHLSVLEYCLCVGSESLNLVSPPTEVFDSLHLRVEEGVFSLPGEGEQISRSHVREEEIHRTTVRGWGRDWYDISGQAIAGWYVSSISGGRGNRRPWAFAEVANQASMALHHPPPYLSWRDVSMSPRRRFPR